jgi:hypothetical protein
VFNGNPNETTWIGNTIYGMNKDYFTPSTLTQIVIHFGTHDHPIAKGMCRTVMEQVKTLV